MLALHRNRAAHPLAAPPWIGLGGSKAAALDPILDTDMKANEIEFSDKDLQELEQLGAVTADIVDAPQGRTTAPELGDEELDLSLDD